MIKKTVVWGLGLVFVAVLSLPAFADQSIGYRHYFDEGVKYFKKHDDQKALRCFKIAQIYDPSDDELKRYLNILGKRGVVFVLPAPVYSREMMAYRYYFSGALEASQKHDDKKAVRYFKIAKIFYPGSREVDRYLEILYQRHGANFPVENQPQVVQVSQVPTPQAVAPQIPEQAMVPENISNQTPAQQQPSSAPSVQTQPAVVVSQPVLYVPVQKANQPPVVLSLAQMTNNGQSKARLQIEYHSSVIIEGKNIKRFLVVDDGFITVKIIDVNRLDVYGKGIGATFLHVWDDFGLHTIYVEVVFPKITNSGTSQVMNGVYHGVPFKVAYSNDWDTYYSGNNVHDIKRQNYEFIQNLAVSGETPYGFFDTSGSYSDVDSISEFNTYTVGLSQIPLEGTSDFDLRGFDATRYLSPLTLPGTTLRGAFADVDLMGDLLGLSVSHGKEQETLGFLATGSSQFNDTYIDAAKLTLFPKSENDRYSFNFATAYGPDHPGYLTDHNYSVQGQHKFNDYLTLNAEEGSDSSHDASLASLRWQEGSFKTGLNFRSIDKSYTTVSTLPDYQGETGAVWTTDGDFDKFTESTYVETFRDRLDANPDHPDLYNYDASGQLRTKMDQNLWSDSDINFVDTPGEISPTRSVGLNERLSRSFGTWNSLKGAVFGGAGYQNNHSPDSNDSDYDREDVIAGIQLPLTNQVSAYANYEYDWLNQPHSGGHSNPNIINTGFEYQKEITPKLSFNSQVDYRDELGVKANSNSFYSGEESVIISSGLSYNPTADVSIFGDANASKVLSHTGDPTEDDFEVHLGMRITFGGLTYWDPLGTVSGIVFKDRNGDGKFAAGDEGIPAVKVKVGDKEAITDKNGRYSIKIRAKGVDVTPVLDTVPGGLLFSTPQSLNVRVFQGRTSHADFGLTSQTGIYGIVFVSKNGTDVPHEGDKFIGRVKVILDGKTIQKSDSHGAFYFRKVIPGEHIISIDLNTLALNMVPLVKLKNEIDVTEGTNYSFNIPVQIKKAEGDQD